MFAFSLRSLEFGRCFPRTLLPFTPETVQHFPEELPHVMSDNEIENRLTNVFREVFDDDTIQLNPSMTARDIDGWDSLTHVRLLLTVERIFNIRIHSHEMSSLKNAGDLIRLIGIKLAPSRTN